MGMSVVDEFRTVDVVLSSGAETRGVDAFALAVIKAERQIRKLFTHLIFQYPAFSKSDVRNLRKALTDSGKVYFDGFFNGFDAISPRSLKDLIGADYDHLKTRLSEARDYRNKIFHGQLTDRYLTFADLQLYVDDIRAWCSALGQSAFAELGYDGFGRNSFQKSQIPNISQRYRTQITSVAEYEDFIRKYMERPRHRACKAG